VSGLSWLPDLPTASGIYLDPDGDAWRLKDGVWTCAQWVDDLDPRFYGPFTRVQAP
jgi:hypothetical protein